jgi:hypothetical protein
MQSSVRGSDFTFSENGVTCITAIGTSLTGGAPAIMAIGTATAGDWTGGDNDVAVVAGLVGS